MGEQVPREGLYIQLQNYTRPYRPGETIVGQLTLFFKTPQEFKYLSVRLEGKAEVHWTRRVSRKSSIGRIHKTIHYRDAERYFLHRIKLLGQLGDDNWSGSVQTLVAGNSVHPFAFTLPQNIPSSFRSMDNVAKVLYQITARLKKPWFSFDNFATIPFQVTGVLDLDLFPEMGHAFIFERSRKMRSNVFSQCLGKAVVHCRMQMPQRIFIPGDVVPLQLEVSNSTADGYVKVTSVSIKLVQNIVYRTRRHRQEACFEICQAMLCSGRENLCDNFYLLLLKIPMHSCPTKLGGHCKLINLQYVLKFEVELGSLSKTLRGRVPVLIGSIPLPVKNEEYESVQVPMLSSETFCDSQNL